METSSEVQLVAIVLYGTIKSVFMTINTNIATRLMSSKNIRI